MKQAELKRMKEGVSNLLLKTLSLRVNAFERPQISMKVLESQWKPLLFWGDSSFSIEQIYGKRGAMNGIDTYGSEN